jgi:kumamolisin
MAERFVIPGSEARNSSVGGWLPVDAEQRITPTIVIRRSSRVGDISEQLLSGSWRQASRAETESFLRVDPDDLAAVFAFAQQCGLTVIAENAEARTVKVQGSVAQIGEAFGIQVQWKLEPDGQKYLSYQGALTIPEELAGIVEAVLGLDQRPVARRGAAR